MVKIGITGSIGAGKSFVGELLREKNFQVLDADRKVHELYRDSQALRQELSDYFGKDCLTPDGVNSALIADKVFADASAREMLEKIVYPYLTESVKKFFDEGEPAVCKFVEAALFSRAPELVEMLDEIWIVGAPEEVRLRRLVSRGLSEADAMRRIKNQQGACAPELFPGKKIHALTNDTDRSMLESQLKNLLKGML